MTTLADPDILGGRPCAVFRKGLRCAYFSRSLGGHTLAVRFGAFTLDARTRQLLEGNRPVHLSPKAFDLLALLVQERKAAISKAEIHQRLWPDTFVSDGSLAVLVTEIRDALCDDARQPAFVRTVHRFGYAFVAPAADVDKGLDSAHARPACWLVWGTERAPLRSGENLIGRDPAAHVYIDAVGISRRHAMIVVAENEATLHDLASKNGTFADDVRITSSVPLQDCVQIRLGPLSIQFRRLGEIPRTQTVDLFPTQKDF